jgi:hypothetical protein
MEKQNPLILVSWKHRHRRASLKQEERGRQAALEALSSGKSPREAACALVNTMFAGRQMIFSNVKIMIDDQVFE